MRSMHGPASPGAPTAGEALDILSHALVHIYVHLQMLASSVDWRTRFVFIGPIATDTVHAWRGTISVVPTACAVVVRDTLDALVAPPHRAPCCGPLLRAKESKAGLLFGSVILLRRIPGNRIVQTIRSRP